MIQWEYEVEACVGPVITDIVRQLNRQGKDGWELMAIAQGWLFYKRPKEHEIQPNQNDS